MTAAPGPGDLRVGSVVIDCNDFPSMLAFWRDALGYEPRYEPEDDWAILRHPNDAGVQVSCRRSRATDREEPAPPRPVHVGSGREIERLLTLGARRYPREPEPDEDFVTLEDPEHNLFDVIDVRGQSEG